MTHKAKKSLGQHFLTAPQTVHSLIEAGQITPDDYVVEVGPGTGALTGALLEKGAHLYAIEKDQDLIEALEDRFAGEIAAGQCTITEGDVLAFDGAALPGNPAHYTVIANIPYYITGAILRTLLTQDHQPDHMAILVQREIAERIVKRDGKESILSLSVLLFGEARLIKRVKPGAFTPPPKVDSAILAIANIGRAHLPQEHEPVFFDLIRRGFRHKRKQFVKNVARGREEQDFFTEFLSAHDLPPTVRAEDIPFESWIALTKAVVDRQGK